MSKRITSTQSTSPVTVPGVPKSASIVGNSNQVTVWYEPKSGTSFKVQVFTGYDDIPDTATFLDRIGDGPNAKFLYVLS